MWEGGSGSGGRGSLRKGTSEEATYRHGQSEVKRGGRKRAEEGVSNGARGRSKRKRGRKGDRDGGKLQGRYPEEDNGQ